MLTSRAPNRPRRAVPMVLLLSFVTWLLPAVPALGTPPDTDVREVAPVWAPVPQGMRALSADAWREALPVPAGDAVMVGLDWTGDAEVEVEVRSSQGGHWGEWVEAHAMTDEAPDDGTPEADRVDTTVSEPIWIGPSDQVQVRVQGDPDDVSLQLVDVVGGDGLAYVAPEDRRRGATAEAATSQPAIRTRASWGADESKRKAPPHVMRDVRFAVVHHTAGSNTYTADQADDVIRAIYAYHLNNGWDDIAYNFMVDRFGRVWEGRYGGMTEAIRGGHAAGWNEASFGVSVLGNFQGTEPPKVAVDAVDQLVAWKLDVHHVDPKGTTTEVAGSGRSSRYSAGTRLELPTIIGHRHTNNTSCPGSNLYNHVIGGNGRTTMSSRVDAVGHPKAYGGLPAEREQPVLGVRPTWDLTFSRPVDWTLRITDAAGAVVRATNGIAATTAEVTWDLKDVSGRLVAPGTYRAELSGRGTAGTVTPVVTTFEVTPPVERRGGATRLETAVELSRWAFDSASRVVIASAEASPDALVASPLAGSLGAPVLLTPKAGLPSVVGTEIKRLRAKTAFIVGGTGRIPTAIESQLKAAGITKVVRLAGPTRYHTAEAVARIVIEREKPTEALLALGDHPDPVRSFADALTAGAFGASRGLPLVLAQPDQLPGPTAELLSDLKPAKLTVVDTVGGIASAVRQQAATSAGARGVVTIAGNDRYETSRLMAEELLARWRAQVAKSGGDPHAMPTGFELVASSGENWPDALGAAAAAAERDVPFVLVAKDSLGASAGIERFLRDHAGPLAHVIVSGGSGAVSDRTTSDIEAIARSSGPHTEPSPVWAPAP